MQVIFYDLETNGLDVLTNSIMQMTMVDDGGGVFLNEYVYPFDGVIAASHIHGIDQKKLETNKFRVIIRTQSAERRLEKKKYKECHAFHFYINLDAKGDVIPCNVFSNNSEYIFGNLYNNTSKEIWTSQRRLDVIEKIKQSNFCHCKDYTCRLDVLNRYLDRVKYPEINDEFI